MCDFQNMPVYNTRRVHVWKNSCLQTRNKSCLRRGATVRGARYANISARYCELLHANSC
jgi:hypothetical protein